MVMEVKITSNSSPSASLSDQRFPPGFRFHPTDEELVLYYLKRKICHKKLLLDAICETDVYKWDPEDLPELSKLKTGDRQWFFFSPRDRKYPNGARSNRATKHGYWKATGKDRSITCNSRAVGVKKTLVFYKGRAPTGIRTDWVMHEYTLDEEEFRRCDSARDYYALYKVFKKSGAGPKNGEQYGAPFKEEEWDDDEYLDPNCSVDQKKSTNPVNDIQPTENPKPNVPFQYPKDDLEGFLNHIGNEPPPLMQPLSIDYSYDMEHLIGEEDSESTLLDQSSRELNVTEQTALQQYYMQASFEVTESGTSQPLLHEASEVTSSAVFNEQTQAVEEDFLEDFLEMDDLLSTEPDIHKFNMPVEKSDTQLLNDFDGLSEFDLYQDAAMFFHDVGTSEGGQAAESYVNNVLNGTVNQASTYFSDYPEIVNGQQLYFNESNEVSDQLWMHDQSSDIFNPDDINQGGIPSGVGYDNNFMNHPAGANPIQIARQDDATNSSLSSSLWALVESIPTTPASAAESALVNKAFERMSSFRRLRLKAINMNVAAGATSRSASKSRRGILCFSLLGVLCAILWVFIGTSFCVMGRCVSS